MTLKQEIDLEEPKKEDTKKKGIAFKSLVEEEERSTRSESENEEDMVMLVRKFNGFMKKNFRARKPIRRDVPNEEHIREHLICYDCKKQSHTMYECYNNKNISTKLKKKTIKFIWSNSNDS
ncbi:Uncharacterized protein TCM_012701 [Theobroma cacao]|uniref:CCHC-type domain-containing protein n=1 Tax=Theobroma cacao TaxID=3641 RepID=A0A061FVL4_THECC|nr:Uncharacterized protein TCM_012701 [Theobroma cacao]